MIEHTERAVPGRLDHEHSMVSEPSRVSGAAMMGSKVLDTVAISPAPHVSPHMVNASRAESDRRAAVSGNAPHLKASEKRLPAIQNETD